MTINAQIVDQRVRALKEKHGRRLVAEAGINDEETRLISTAFLFLCVQTVLDLSDDDVIDSIVDGGHDMGIDAIRIEDTSDLEFSIVLFQSVYKSRQDALSEFSENDVARVVQTVSILFDPDRKIEMNPRLATRVEEARSFVRDGKLPSVKVFLCNNGRPWNKAAQGHIDRARYGDQVTWSHIDPDRIVAFLQSTKSVDDTLTLAGKAIVEDFDFRRVIVGKVNVHDLAALFDKHGDRLLDKNIRRYLGLAGNRVNEAIASTLRNERQSQNFYFYNNGITIVCTQFRYNALTEANWKVQISGIQVINGGQTCKTIQSVLRESREFGKDSLVLVRIYELPREDPDLISSITLATNSQNPVDLRDLRSNDPRQLRLGTMIEPLGYAYKRKRDDVATSPTDLTSGAVAEAVLAIWRERPHQARFKSTDHFGGLYEVIFSDDLNGAQAIIATLIHRMVENRRKRPLPSDPDFLPYASRFISMLIGAQLVSAANVPLSRIDHRNFNRIETLLETRFEPCFQNAVSVVEKYLDTHYPSEDRTLQKLSAAFRRADMIADMKRLVSH